MPKFAANLSLLFNEVDFLERFGAARVAGFDAVEFLFPYAYDARQLAALQRQHQLQTVLFNLHPGDWDNGERGMACDPRRSDEFKASVRQALDYALVMNVKQLHCLSGIVPNGVGMERARAAVVASLQYAADLCQPHGIAILIEPLNHWDAPGYFLTHSGQAADIIADCGRPNLFLQYDIYHMQRMEGELSNTISRLLPLIRHIQVADTPGRHEPGSGEINFRHLFALLDRIGYTGWVGCEYRPAGATLAGLAWRDTLHTPPA